MTSSSVGHPHCMPEYSFKLSHASIRFVLIGCWFGTILFPFAIWALIKFTWQSNKLKKKLKPNTTPLLQCGSEFLIVNQVCKCISQSLQGAVMKIFVACGSRICWEEDTKPSDESLASCCFTAAVCHHASDDHLSLSKLLEMALQICVVECTVGVLWPNKLITLHYRKNRATCSKNWHVICDIPVHDFWRLVAHGFLICAIQAWKSWRNASKAGN